MTRRATVLLGILAAGAASTVAAQRNVVRRYDATTHAGVQRTAYGVQPGSWRRDIPHYGKWLTAAGSAVLTVFAATEHRRSRREWSSLLAICRSAQDACTLGADGRYLRTDAESYYQRSRAHDKRANRWLLGAQASLLATTALFIIDLNPGAGPDNIPFAPMRVGMRVPF